LDRRLRKLEGKWYEYATTNPTALQIIKKWTGKKNLKVLKGELSKNARARHNYDCWPNEPKLEISNTTNINDFMDESGNLPISIFPYVLCNEDIPGLKPVTTYSEFFLPYFRNGLTKYERQLLSELVLKHPSQGSEHFWEVVSVLDDFDAIKRTSFHHEDSYPSDEGILLRYLAVNPHRTDQVIAEYEKISRFQTIMPIRLYGNEFRLVGALTNGDSVDIELDIYSDGCDVYSWVDILPTMVGDRVYIQVDDNLVEFSSISVVRPDIYLTNIQGVIKARVPSGTIKSISRNKILLQNGDFVLDYDLDSSKITEITYSPQLIRTKKFLNALKDQNKPDLGSGRRNVVKRLKLPDGQTVILYYLDYKFHISRFNIKTKDEVVLLTLDGVSTPQVQLVGTKLILGGTYYDGYFPAMIIDALNSDVTYLTNGKQEASVTAYDQRHVFVCGQNEKYVYDLKQNVKTDIEIGENLQCPYKGGSYINFPIDGLFFLRDPGLC